MYRTPVSLPMAGGLRPDIVHRVFNVLFDLLRIRGQLEQLSHAAEALLQPEARRGRARLDKPIPIVTHLREVEPLR